MGQQSSSCFLGEGEKYQSSNVNSDIYCKPDKNHTEHDNPSQDNKEVKITESSEDFDIDIYCLYSSKTCDMRTLINPISDINVTFVDRVRPKSSLVDCYVEQKDFDNEDLRQKIAGYLSHIKVLRKFVEKSKKKGCIVCDDHLILHQLFLTRLPEILKYGNLLSLSWISSADIRPSTCDKFCIVPIASLTTITDIQTKCYYISKSESLTILRKYDHLTTLTESPSDLTYSLDTIINSRGYLVFGALKPDNSKEAN